MKILKSVLLISFCAMLLTGCAQVGDQDLPQMLVNLQKSLQPIWAALIALSYVLGIFFIAIAILKLKQYGQITVMMATHANLGPSLAYLIVGAGLLFLPTFLNVMTVTTWGYGVEQIPPYEAGRTFDVSDIMVPLTQLVQVIGLIAFIRGWVMLIKIGGHGGPPGTLSKGLTHMLGGILAINIVGTIDVLKATFGLV